MESLKKILKDQGLPDSTADKWISLLTDDEKCTCESATGWFNGKYTLTDGEEIDMTDEWLDDPELTKRVCESEEIYIFCMIEEFVQNTQKGERDESTKAGQNSR